MVTSRAVCRSFLLASAITGISLLTIILAKGAHENWNNEGSTATLQQWLLGAMECTFAILIITVALKFTSAGKRVSRATTECIGSSWTIENARIAVAFSNAMLCFAVAISLVMFASAYRSGDLTKALIFLYSLLDSNKP